MRRKPDNGRTDHASIARRWPPENPRPRMTPRRPNTMARAARTRCSRSAVISRGSTTARCATTGTSPGATMRQPPRSIANPAVHCAATAGRLSMATSRRAPVRTSDPLPVHAAWPRRPSAGLRAARSNTRSWRPPGPCSAESVEYDTPRPCATAVCSSASAAASRPTMSPVGTSPASISRNSGVRTVASARRSPLRSSGSVAA